MTFRFQQSRQQPPFPRERKKKSNPERLTSAHGLHVSISFVRSFRVNRVSMGKPTRAIPQTHTDTAGRTHSFASSATASAFDDGIHLHKKTTTEMFRVVGCIGDNPIRSVGLQCHGGCLRSIVDWAGRKNTNDDYNRQDRPDSSSIQKQQPVRS